MTAGQIIEKLGGPTALSTSLGAPLGTVSAWSTRNSIPPEYWPALVSLAGTLGKTEVTFEALAHEAAAIAKRKSSEKAGASV